MGFENYLAFGEDWGRFCVFSKDIEPSPVFCNDNLRELSLFIWRIIMKKKLIIIICASIATVLALAFVIFPLISFSREKALSRVTTIYEKNKDVFLQAIEKDDYSPLVSVFGEKNISIEKSSAERFSVIIGVYGFASSGGYYGIYYASDDYISDAWPSPCPSDDYLIPTADGGFEYKGNDYYYVRNIEGHFYYYEAFY